MKNLVLLPIALALLPSLGLCNTTNSTNSSSPFITAAIFDFESKEESVKELGSKIGVLINAHLSAASDLVLVERAELEKALGEQELGLSGTVSGETAAKVGRLTGAKVLVTGKVFKADRELMVVAKIIGTETSRVYGELVKGPVSSSISDLASEMAGKIAATITAKADTLLARISTREDRVADLKKALGEVKLPTVSVRIPEQHFGAPAADPAAETELSLLLQQCGFTVVDEKSAVKPEIEITGEAFSAHGLRRGNLITCKARIELKAHQRKDGKILAIDRETSVAVDITEQTSAKSALQAAAAEVASRVIPRLVPGAKVASR